ncbi:MAG: AMP-binding protein [Acidimicrobiales bacterium]|nr:AMP-binding protein [Acidimicrobiales bacterium]
MTPWAAHLPPGMAPADVDLLGAGNLARAWTARWDADGSHPTIHDGQSGWLSAAELEDRTRAVAGRLAVAGLEPGDRILLSAAASVDLVVAHVAALRSGLVVVPTNTAYLEREVAHVVRDARPAAAVVDVDARGRWVEAASGERPMLVLGPSVDLPDGRSPTHLDAADTDDPALIAYTSGTTGSPKGAVLSHGNLLASAEALTVAWRWTAEDRLVLALPLFHLHGLGVGPHGTLVAGASVALRPSFAPDDVFDAVATHDATLFFGVPTMWSRLAASDRAGELARLRLGVSGSAPLAAELHRALADRCGQQLIERYGMTETVMNVSNPYDGERRPGTVGLPLPGVDLRLDGSTDEILVRGPNVFAGYWERPDATAESFDGDWFRTGDVGALDDDGYLRIVGRRKELIISGGFNVYPREVEDVLRAHPSIDDVAVVGVPHPDWGEQVVAVAEGPGGPGDADAVLALAATQLAAYKRPKRIVWVDDLPRNALGKVIKADVARLLRG